MGQGLGHPALVGQAGGGGGGADVESGGGGGSPLEEMGSWTPLRPAEQYPPQCASLTSNGL